MQKATRNQTGFDERRHDSGQFFHARIARVTRLARTIVSRVFADSRVRELVKEPGDVPPASGESPIFSCAIDHSRHVIGVDLALDRFRGSVINRQVDSCRNDCGRGKSTFHASTEGLSVLHLGPREGGAFQRQEVLSAD